MNDIDKSFVESYDVIKKARTEIEKLQFGKGLHNDVTESVKQTLVSLENKLLARRIERPSTMGRLENYKSKVRENDKTKPNIKTRSKTEGRCF